MSNESTLQKIRAFYNLTGRVPVSKDYRSDYHNSGLPHWHTIRKNFPGKTYDSIISEALGFPTFDELLHDLIIQKDSSIIFVNARALLKNGHWASKTAVSRWLSSQDGKIIHGYRLSLYLGGTRENGHLFKLTKTAYAQFKCLLAEEVTA